MIKVKVLGIIVMAVLLLSSCSTVSVKTETSNTKTVEDVLSEKIEGNTDEEEQVVPDDTIAKDQVALLVEEIEKSLVEEGDVLNPATIEWEAESLEVDYMSEDYIDLTTLSKDMVYAVVYQMMINPQDFIGKKIQMKGSFSVFYDDVTKKNYFAVLIEDALACCASGVEFTWGDGQHVFPDEYPEEGTTIVVSGIFETYTESGNSNEFIRLREATLELD